MCKVYVTGSSHMYVVLPYNKIIIATFNDVAIYVEMYTVKLHEIVCKQIPSIQEVISTSIDAPIQIPVSVSMLFL